jgi:hypothetical protein
MICDSRAFDWPTAWTIPAPARHTLRGLLAGHTRPAPAVNFGVQTELVPRRENSPMVNMR